MRCARRLTQLLVGLLALCASPAAADGQRNCRNGKPCGNTCIPRDAVCRVESPGTVGRATPARPPPVRDLPFPPRAEPTPRPLGRTAPCTVTRVVDGDTIECAGGERVRLLMIDAPERSQAPYGAVATRALRQLNPVGSRATLELDVQQRDRYGRLLAYVYAADGRMANEEMVRGGYALIYTYAPNVRYVERFERAQREARSARRGLWATRAFDCPPAAHRRRAC